MEITLDTKIGSIDGLKELEKYLIYTILDDKPDLMQQSPADMQKASPTWQARGILRGIQMLHRCIQQGRKLFYPIYDSADCTDDPQKADVGIWYFPAVNKKENAPFIISCAGGSYQYVCSIVEAFPATAHFVELGYDVFVLNYRVGGNRVVPKALEDLASAYRYIISNKALWNLTTEEYVLNGFSAGANLTSLWGTRQKGYGAFNLPKPKALIPIYTFLSTRYVKSPEDEQFRQFMVGDGDIDEYDVELLFDETYPPCYLVACKDDYVVSAHNSVRMKELLDSKGIPAGLFLGETGEHGFGDGSDTDVEGWPEKAIEFIESLG